MIKLKNYLNEALMQINEAYDFFTQLLNQSNKKSDRKTYKSFMDIFENLKTREFSDTEILSIENKIDQLKFDSIPNGKSKDYKKRLNEFKKYLKNEFSLVPKGYYTELGVAMGTAFGAAFGMFPFVWKILFGIESEFERSLGIALGISIGTFIGIIIGKNMDASAEKRNRVFG